ncbi:MAG: ATP-binding protein [Spirochaetaceae bacterium]|jgi:predicted AAA+ superfamily ATPase|nr:ATP-binding protein [Spirochaetaceae bacterium]
MKAEDFYRVMADIAGLSVFSTLKEHPLIKALGRVLRVLAPDREKGKDGALEILRAWAAFTGTFFSYNPETSFYAALASLAGGDENPFTLAVEAGRGRDSPPLLAAARTDLSRLGRIARFDTAGLGFHIAALLREEGLEEAAEDGEKIARALWLAEGAGCSGIDPSVIFPPDADWGEALPALEDYIASHGAGLLGQYHSFFWGAPGLLSPIRNPDPVELSQLAGYGDQRSLVVSNTLRFIQGKPANNLLLYGDRGTGKSATVKAVCNEFAPRGLRLLELRKPDLPCLPAILETLAPRALRFVIFLDDLSFENTDDSFTTLKALLEGGGEAKPANVVVYATGNRRHLVKEWFSDRPAAAGEVRAFDAMQEQFSLADRFGLTVIFTSPSPEEYLEIACFIAEKRGLLKAGDERTRDAFRENALRWERWFNGRSPRTAVQYVDWVEGGGGFPWEDIAVTRE